MGPNVCCMQSATLLDLYANDVNMYEPIEQAIGATVNIDVAAFPQTGHDTTGQ